MLAAGDRVVVAVSGGPDSLCLFHVLRELRSSLDLHLHVAHLNHMLRGDASDADADYVAGIAREWGIEATIEKADVRAYREEHRLSLEHAARLVRYDFLSRVARSVGAQAIAVGHNADDQVETILMHMLRGAGLTGLHGMLPVQEWPNGLRLIRPLLSVHRRDIEQYCADHGLQPRLDRSNDDERIWRNRLRRTVLPALEQASPRLRASLLRTANLLADEDSYLAAQAQALWPTVASETRGGAVSFDRRAWQALPVAMQRRTLRLAWAHVAATYEDLTWRHVENVRTFVNISAPRRPQATLNLPHGVCVLRSAEEFRLTLAPDGGGGSPSTPWLTVDSLLIAVPGDTALPGTPWLVRTSMQECGSADVAIQPVGSLTEHFDAEAAGSGLTLRRWRHGDRMQPLGMAGTRKLHDIMIDAHIAQARRASIPLLATPEHVLWLAGARRSDFGKLTATTQRILSVSFVEQGQQP